MDDKVILISIPLDQLGELIEAKVVAAMRVVNNPLAKPEFIPEENKLYKLDNPNIVELFGEKNSRQPAQNIYRKLRNAGIEPIKHGRAGAEITGDHIIRYFEHIKYSQTSFTRK